MLNENRAQERVIWGAYLDNGGRTQARAQVTKPGPPRSQGPASGNQQAALALDARIVEVKQSVLRRPIRIVDCDLPRKFVEEMRQRRFCQRFSCDHESRCTFPPEMSKMRLAAAGRTMQHEHCRGPIGPSIDPLDGRDVASRNHEIRSPKSRTARQVESELDHTKRIIGPARRRESHSSHKACSVRAS